MITSFAFTSPNEMLDVKRAFVSPPPHVQVREFTPEQARDRLDRASDSDEEVLWKAQKVIDYTQSMVQQARELDDKDDDGDKAMGKFHREAADVAPNSRGERSSSNYQVDLTPGAESFAYHNEITGEHGERSSIDAYFRQDRDCQLAGYKDHTGAVEVLIAPSGALTVFTSP